MPNWTDENGVSHYTGGREKPEPDVDSQRLIKVSFVVDKTVRRAIRARLGKPGLATNKEVAAEIEAIVEATFQDYTHELEQRKRNR